MTFQALTIAGSDSSGGAGIQADLKTFSALGVYGASAITAITAQNTQGVFAVEAVTPSMIASQIEAVFADLSISAIKVGMLGDVPAIEAVACLLLGTDIPLVVDPVMVAKSGDLLLPASAVDALRQLFLPKAFLLTPNLPEAAHLLGVEVAQTPEQMEEQGKALIDLGAQAVLMKGGHGKSAVCTDVLVLPNRVEVFAVERQLTTNLHGTGCTFAAAITANLAKGLSLVAAVEQAHGYLQNAIFAGSAAGFQVGHGQGPVHHFYQQW